MNEIRINGPTLLSYHQNVHNKEIFIMGDSHHSLKDMCNDGGIYIWDIFKYMFTLKNKSGIIDHYLEANFYPNNIISINELIKLINDNENLDVINEIMKTIGIKCYYQYLLSDEDRKMCQVKYPDVRFHNTDIRHVSTYIPFLKYLFLYFSRSNIISSSNIESYINKILEIDDGSMIIKIIEKIIFIIIKSNYFLKDINKFFADIEYYEKIPSYLIRTIYKSGKCIECHKIRKQILLCDKEIRIKIYEYVHDKLKHLNKKYKFNLKEGGVKKFYYYVLKTYSLMMDVYSIARIFKKSLSDSRKVIVYVGHYHAKQYNDFISKYLDNGNYYLARKVNERCIEVDRKILKKLLM